MALRPLDARTLTLLVKDMFPDGGYVDFDSTSNMYFIGEYDYLFAVLNNNGKHPSLMLRASLKPMEAATLGYIVSAACDFKFGRVFEINYDGRWVYDAKAEGVAADSIYSLWFGIDPPVDEDGRVGFVSKTKAELEEMN